MAGMHVVGGACLGLAQQSVQPTFPSATEASQRLLQAVQSNNEQTIASILGHLSPESTQIYAKVDIETLRRAALDPEVFHE